MDFPDNNLLQDLIGPHDINLKKVEEQFGVEITLRGNTCIITGIEDDANQAKATMNYLYERLKMGKSVDTEQLQQAIKISQNVVEISSSTVTNGGIQTRKKMISPRSKKQSEYVEAMQNHDLVFGIGPAGTGKTYLAVAYGVSLLISNQVERIILSRPAVEAGEKLGFLPGDLKEKVDPYLRPLYDAMHTMLSSEQIEKRIATGDIEIAPLAFMRGRTLSNAFVILDEAQNTTSQQMKMFLTRLGHNSRMIITGDISQIDLPQGTQSGLVEAYQLLSNVPEINFTEFSEIDVVRHPIVSKIIRAYDSNK